jgi:hypothetical protein
MTKLLIKVLREVGELPEDRRDDEAHLIQAMLENEALDYDLTDAQLEDVDQAFADVVAGKFASDAQSRDALYRPWA